MNRKVKIHSTAAIFLSVIALLILILAGRAGAQTASELQDKIAGRNNDISQLESEIKSYQDQLAALGSQASSLTVSLQQLDLTRKKLSADIKLTQDKIEAANLTIQQLSLDIGNKEEKISSNKDALAQGIRDINSIDLKNIFEALLSQNTLSDVWNEAESLRSVNSKISTQAEVLKSAKQDLQENKDKAEKARQELVSLKSELNDQKKINDQNTAAKNQLLKSTKNSQSNYVKMLAADLARKAAFEKDVRDYESQLKFILDPSSLPKSGSSVLSWPLDNIYITQLFGATVDAKRLYVSGSHSGVDFAASVGTPVKSVAGGVVLGTGNTDIACPRASYGQWVLVKHSNGLSSIYGHLSLIKVSAGDVVAAGQLVGYSGNTGYTTGPHLHLGIFASSGVQVKNLPSASCAGRVYTMPVAPINAYLDPMLYLPPYNH
jgi:murein DD-endopeptidase MepM/ murein hydrolase activator NlpD